MASHSLSIRSATTLTVVSVGALFILSSWMAGSYFRHAAHEAQAKSLARIIDVASHQVLENIERHAMELGTVLNSQNRLGTAYSQLEKNKDPTALQQLLDDPLVNGFVGAGQIELVKLRVFSEKLEYMGASRAGMSGLPRQLPRFLHRKATARSGTERLKATGGLWLFGDTPLYSLLLPIGGLQLDGYLEVVINPAFTLSKIETITRIPIFISRTNEKPKLDRQAIQGRGMIPIEFILTTEDGVPAFRFTGLEDVSKLHQDMDRHQLLTTITLTAITFSLLLLVLLLLNRGVFKPIRQMVSALDQYREGNLETSIEPSGLSELHRLGSAFNSMLKRIRKDITELERHSNSDGLTGLANRRYFAQYLDAEWSRASRQLSPLSLLFIDIDYFKRFNDRYGHLKGDQCLQHVAIAIESAASRDHDLAARYGGEEFVILLPDTATEGARRVAENLQSAVTQLQIDNEDSSIEHCLTLSIGISTEVPRFPERPKNLIARADKALYLAKANGRNRIEILESE